MTGGQDQFAPIVLDRLESQGVRRPAIVTLGKEYEPLWANEIVELYHQWMSRRGQAARVADKFLADWPRDRNDG